MTPARTPTLVDHSLAQARLALQNAPQTRAWTSDCQRLALSLVSQLGAPLDRSGRLQVLTALRELTTPLDPPSGTIVRSSLEALDSLLREEEVDDDHG